MFKSKHSGWTWELKRTPFGGGGGGWNPVAWVAPITDTISSAIGTDGGGGGLLGELANIDPGPAIGDTLASVDQAVNQIPGGWITVAGIAAGGAALAYAPEVMALSAAEGITPEAAAIATGTAPIDVATGATVPLDTLAADVAVSAPVTTTPAADAILAAPDIVAPSITPSTGGTFGSITAPLEGSGAVSGAGATTLGGGGLTGALPSGVVVGDGTLGTTVGATYMATDAGTLATDMFGNAIPASSTGIGGFAADTGLSASDIATNAKRLQSIAKLLGGTNTSNISGRAAPTAGQWATQAAQNFAQATPQQFGGLYEMNKNPFTFQNPLANALAGNKPATGLDVSGTPGTALNTSQQNQIYSSLLRS